MYSFYSLDKLKISKGKQFAIISVSDTYNKLVRNEVEFGIMLCKSFEYSFFDRKISVTIVSKCSVGFIDHRNI